MLSSLLPLYYGDIVALLYKKLDAGSQLSFGKDSVENLVYIYKDIITQRIHYIKHIYYNYCGWDIAYRNTQNSIFKTITSHQSDAHKLSDPPL